MILIKLFKKRKENVLLLINIAVINFRNVQKLSDLKEAAHLQQKSSVSSPIPPAMTPGVEALCPQTVQLSFAPPPCCSFVPVLVPQAVYVSHTPVRPRPVARPLPSSTAVRSMTFESPRGANTKASPASVTVTGQRRRPGYEPASPALKRTCLEGSPAKIKRTETNSKVNMRVCKPEFNVWWNITLIDIHLYMREENIQRAANLQRGLIQYICYLSNVIYQYNTTTLILANCAPYLFTYLLASLERSKLLTFPPSEPKSVTPCRSY